MWSSMSVCPERFGSQHVLPCSTSNMNLRSGAKHTWRQSSKNYHLIYSSGTTSHGSCSSFCSTWGMFQPCNTVKLFVLLWMGEIMTRGSIVAKLPSTPFHSVLYLGSVHYGHRSVLLGWLLVSLFIPALGSLLVSITTSMLMTCRS